MLLIQLTKARQKIAMIIFQRFPKIFQLLTKDCQIQLPHKSVVITKSAEKEFQG
jgi:hypothetical protein